MTNSEHLLKDELDALPGELQPERDLWSGIEHDLYAAPARSYFSMSNLAIAASLVLMVLFVSTQFPGPTVNNIDPNVLQILSALQSQHSQNKQTLLVTYTENNPSYENWEFEMQQLEDAEALIYEDLLEDPGNLALLSILRQVQNQQLELINTVYAPRMTAI